MTSLPSQPSPQPARHVVLGGNGVVGRETLRALLERGVQPVSVGRRPSDVDGVTSVVADLLDADDAARALKGADVAYLTVGLPYSAKVWARDWPTLASNVIAAATSNNTRLVYLDNVYAYGRVDGPMTERTPVRPAGAKGEARADVLRLLDAAAARGLSVTVARSADFYGPGATTSMVNGFVIDKVAAGKPGTWIFDADQPHSLTYTPDIGDALALLGTAPRPATGAPQVWHLPTAPAVTGREVIALAAGPDARTSVMSATTMRIGALFNSAARETLAMAYQYTSPYVFDSTRFEEAFGMTPTPLADGLRAAVAAARAS